MLYKVYGEKVSFIKIAEIIKNENPYMAQNILDQLEAQEDRRPYNKAYRIANKEKIKEQRAKKWLRRKERMKNDNQKGKRVSANTKAKKSVGDKVHRVSKTSKRNTSLYRQKSR